MITMMARWTLTALDVIVSKTVRPDGLALVPKRPVPLLVTLAPRPCTCPIPATIG